MRAALVNVLVLTATLLAQPGRAGLVTTTADDGPGSLREAITNATVGETITFAVTGTITLTGGELLISRDLNIAGPGPGNLTIQRSPAGATPSFRIFNLLSGVGTITGLTINNGRAAAGGGINNESTLTLRDCVISGNSATENGGGINNLSTLNLTNCVIHHNSAGDGVLAASGGGVHNEGTLTMLGCLVSSNSVMGGTVGGALGGGINNLGTMAVTNCMIIGNSVTGADGTDGIGGGIKNEGTADLQTSTIGFNSATGGIGDPGGAGQGGGIANGFGTLTLNRSTVSSNSAAGGAGTTGAGQGGGIANRFGTVIVENSTVSGNVAGAGAGGNPSGPTGGGGIFNGFGSTSLKHCTVAANVAPAADGGGLLNPAGVVEMKNTILAANLAAVDISTDPDGGVSSGGFNLLGTTDRPIAPGSGDQFNVTAAALRVGPLQANGGPTFTHALLCGSPAIDAGDNANAPATDQRGFARIVRGLIDIGAYEEANTAPTVSCPAPISTNGPPTGQVATVSVNVADADGDALTVVWTVDGMPVQTNAVPAGGPPTSASVALTANFGPGAHPILVSVSDANGCAASCSTTVTVQVGLAGIGVTKSCPPTLIQPGRLVNVTGTVTNTGSLLLTNVSVTNVIAALGGLTRRVLGPITLAPGVGATWMDTYTVPVDSCPPYGDTATATGTTAGGGVGEVVTASDTRSCPGTNSPRIYLTRNCPLVPVSPGGIAVYSGIVSNAGNVSLTNVLIVDPATSTTLLGPITLSPGQFANYLHNAPVPSDCCEHVTTVTATGRDKCFGRTVTDSASTVCQAATAGKINVTIACPPEPVTLGEFLIFSGVVSNAGNVALANVTVVINQPSNHTPVLGPIVLAAGEVEEFFGAYFVPFDTCATNILNIVTARGSDVCNDVVVSNTASADCPILATPRLAITKSCPTGLVQPGGALNFSGTLSNAGNVTLTNVIVVNDHPTNNTPVFGPVTLSPGQSTSFTGSYAVAADFCPPYVDVLTATGTSVCGSNVVATATAACAGTNSPRIMVTKNCPPGPAAPGDLVLFSGTVSNAGNISLINVFVAESTPGNNAVLLGPITLAPGQTSNYTASYRVPANCCSYVNTVIATGADKCFGRTVAHSATTVCQTSTEARLSVTKVCPPTPVRLGEFLVFSGVVSNAGNISLTNVTVVNNQPSNNTPVLGPITLAPRETAFFLGGYLVPINTCATNILDTVTARGVNGCNGAVVSNSASATCPIVATPRLVVTKNCPANPVPPGGVLNFSGTVSNAGNVTLTNVRVVNDHPTNNTPVFGPVTLAPGQSTNFSGSYKVCTFCCPPFVDTLTATGADACNGSNVTASATAACPGSTTPQLTVRANCPPKPVAQGELFNYSGTVSNSGNVALTDVLVADDKAGYLTYLTALAPGEAAGFIGSFIPTNCGPDFTVSVNASALNACTGDAVINQLNAVCPVICVAPSSPPLAITNPHLSGNEFRFSFLTESGLTYTVQYSLLSAPADWQPLTDFIGDGGTAFIEVPRTNAQCYYRVLVQ